MTAFAELGLSEAALAAVERMGYDAPTPVQEQSIPYILEGRDVIAAASTGTGKTAAFLLPTLSTLPRVKGRGRAPRVWGSFDRAVRTVVTCTGSAGPTGRAALAAGADVLVAGEVKYHDALDLSQAGMAVIDLGHDTSELPFCGVLAASVRDAGVPDELVAVVSQRDRWSYPEAVRV